MSQIVYDNKSDFTLLFDLTTANITNLYNLFNFFSNNTLNYLTFDEYNYVRIILDFLYKERQMTEKEYTEYLTTRTTMLNEIYIGAEKKNVYLNQGILTADKLEIKVDNLLEHTIRNEFDAADVKSTGKITFDEFMYCLFAYGQVTRDKYMAIISLPAGERLKYVEFFYAMSMGKAYLQMSQQGYDGVHQIVTTFGIGAISDADITNKSIIFYNDPTFHADVDLKQYYYTYFKFTKINFFSLRANMENVYWIFDFVGSFIP